MENFDRDAFAWFNKMGVKEEVMEIMVEKLKEALIAMENIGGDGFAWFNKMGAEEVMKIVVEKLKEALIAMENIGGDAFAWFNKMGAEEVMKIVVEKLKEALIAMENIGGDAFTWFNKMGAEEVMKILVEKLKEALIAIENIGGHAFAWFNKIHHWLPIAQPFLITAVILSFIFYFCKGRGIGKMMIFYFCKGRGIGKMMIFYFCKGGGIGKMMKAPGRNCKMPRRVFESNPKGYFRNLRAYPNGDGLPSVQSCLINVRESIKETDEYKRAVEEEWASRQQALQIQAEEAQRQRKLHKRRKAESLRRLDMERRQKERLDEIRNTQKEDEKNMSLKEAIRAEVRKDLKKLEVSCRNMASLLHCLGIRVGGWPKPLPQEVQIAYKKALRTFHPDKASRSDIRQQVEAEEKFKLINSLKEIFPLQI